MGTRNNISIDKLADEDHPHAYGDKNSYSTQGANDKGSSPRVWGQVSGQISRIVSAGIIPTRMGTRSILLCHMLTVTDHPHAYGDKNCPQMRASVAQGSSPRVWGQENAGNNAKI